MTPTECWRHRQNLRFDTDEDYYDFLSKIEHYGKGLGYELGVFDAQQEDMWRNQMVVSSEKHFV